MVREATRLRIDFAHGRASSKLTSDIGANIVWRWHSTHLEYKIGATSFAKVGVCATARPGATSRAAITMPTLTIGIRHIRPRKAAMPPKNRQRDGVICVP